MIIKCQYCKLEHISTVLIVSLKHSLLAFRHMKTLYNSSLENLYERRHFDEAGTSHDGVMEVKMEKVRGCLQLSREESESVSRLNIHPHRVGVDCSFYEYFTLRGIRVERVEPGLVSCSFTIPPRLTVSYPK